MWGLGIGWFRLHELPLNAATFIDPQGEAARLLVESHLARPLAVPSPF